MTKAADAENRKLTVVAKDDAEAATKRAKIFTRPVVMTANTMLNLHAEQKLNLTDMMEALSDYSENARETNLEPLEKMLIGQMHVLHNMFNKAVNHWNSAQYMPQYQGYGAVALKAQNLCCMTAATLADMRNPSRTTFIKNTAQNQQINMGESSPKNSGKFSNELLSEESHETMDTGGTGKAGGTDKELAAVEKGRR